MTANQPALLDIVALLRDMPEHQLERGRVGTVVDIADDRELLLVEFADADGQMTTMPALSPADLLVLRYETAAAE